MAKLVSKTYGEALFDLGIEEQSLETLAQEAGVILEAISENPELLKLLNHPKIVKEEKVTVVEQIFKGHVSDTMVGFLVLVVQKDRHNEIQEILTYFLEQVRENKKMGVAEVTSAVPLSEEQKKQIKDKLLASTDYVNYEMHFCVDEAIIGGLIIRVGDRVVDSSVRTRINLMAKELANIQLH